MKIRSAITSCYTLRPRFDSFFFMFGTRSQFHFPFSARRLLHRLLRTVLTVPDEIICNVPIRSTKTEPHFEYTFYLAFSAEILLHFCWIYGSQLRTVNSTTGISEFRIGSCNIPTFILTTLWIANFQCGYKNV